MNLVSLLSCHILECDEEVTVISCSYTSPPTFYEMSCDLNVDFMYVSLEQNEKSWIEVTFDQAYNLESLKLGQTYGIMAPPPVLGPGSSAVANTVPEKLSIVIWIEFSDGRRILATVVDRDKNSDEIVFVNFIQTTSIKMGIESVTGSLSMYGFEKLDIFGCSLSK